MFRNLLTSLERPCFFRASVFSKVKFKHLFYRQWIHYFLCFVSNDEVNTQVFHRGAFMSQDCVARGDYRRFRGLGASDGSNNTPSKQCTYCVGIFTFACDDFFRFDRLRTIATNEEARTISMLSSNLGILSFIFLRWGHLSAISGVGI